MNNSLVTLWRPVGPAELELIRASGMLRFRRGFPSSPAGHQAATTPRRGRHMSAKHQARLGADLTRYVFIAKDLHLLLLAGLPARGHRTLRSCESGDVEHVIRQNARFHVLAADGGVGFVDEEDKAA